MISGGPPWLEESGFLADFAGGEKNGFVPAGFLPASPLSGPRSSQSVCSGTVQVGFSLTAFKS